LGTALLKENTYKNTPAQFQAGVFFYAHHRPGGGGIDPGGGGGIDPGLMIAPGICWVPGADLKFWF